MKYKFSEDIIGTVLAIPAGNGKNGVSQIVGTKADGLPGYRLIIFNISYSSKLGNIDMHELLPQNVIAMLNIDVGLEKKIKSEQWPLLATVKPVMENPPLLCQLRWKRYQSKSLHNTELLEGFVQALHGSRPWNYFKHPDFGDNFFDTFLLSSKDRPIDVYFE
jgi:hypothetical protein